MSHLLESLGYKQESPRRTNIGGQSLLNDYSGPYNPSTSNRRSQQFEYESKSNSFNTSQPLQQINQNNFYPSTNTNPNNFISSSHTNNQNSQPMSFYGSPKRHNRSSNIEIKEDNTQSNNKYLSIPRKSMLSSGLGAISPIPSRPKYTSNTNVNNKLDLDNMRPNDTLMPAPISPIKHKNNNNNTLFSDNLHGLNTTNNTLNLTNNLGISGIGGPNPMESRMSIIRAEPNDINISNNKQILVIGFPPSEASFIHRKFKQYGNFVNAIPNKNTLVLEYLNKEGAIRALAENAKWIKNGNLQYMISVIYYEIAKQNNDQSGRFLNLNEINRNKNKNNMNQTRHFVSNGYQNVEREIDLQSGPTHILWKIFNFITSGW